MSAIVAHIHNDNYGHFSPKARRKFTPQEDEALKFLISQFGSDNWIQIAQLMPGRNPKQCRDRFYNYLSEFQRKDPWEPREDEILLNLLSIIGTKWVEIARHIPGRSGNDAKNRWYKHLCKKHPIYNGIILAQNKYKSNDKNHLQVKDNAIKKSEKIENLCKQYSISALLI